MENAARRLRNTASDHLALRGSEHTRTHTNKRPANLNQPPVQYIQLEVRQYTDIRVHNP